MRKIYNNPRFAFIIRNTAILYVIVSIIYTYKIGDIIFSKYRYTSLINLGVGVMILYKTEIMKSNHRKLYYFFIVILFIIYATVFYYNR
jgi:hypothetical protein